MADEVIGRPRLELEATRTKLDKDLKAAGAAVGAELARSEKTLKAANARIQANIDKINAVRPRQQMFELGVAIERMGGVSKLSADKVARLRTEVERLSAAGARVPKNLAGLGVGAGAAQRSIAAAQASALGGLAAGGPGGAIGAGLAAAGPAGLALAASLGAVAVAGGAAVRVMSDLVQRSGQLVDLSTKTRLSTDFLQQLEFAGAQVGVSMEQSALAVVKLQRTLGEAAQGSQQARQAFTQIGVSWQQLRTLKPEEQFITVARALTAIPDQERMVAAGADLMGRGFADIIPILSDLERQMKLATEVGAVLPAELVKEADKIGDAFDRQGKAIDALKLQFGAAILKAITGSADAVVAIDSMSQAIGRVASGVGKLVPLLSFLSKFSLPVQLLKVLEITGGGARTTPPSARTAEEFMAANIGLEEELGADKDFQEELKRKKELDKKEEESAKKRIALAKHAAEERKRIEQQNFQLRLEEYRREVKAAEEFWKKQEGLAKAATDRILAEWLLATGKSREQINELGEQVEIVSQAAIDAARRRVSAELGGAGRLMSEISDTGLPTGFFTRDAEIARELGIQVGQLTNNLTAAKDEAFDLEAAFAGAANFLDLMGDGADNFAGRLSAALPAIGQMVQQFRTAEGPNATEQRIGAGAGIGQMLGGAIGGRAGRTLGGAASGAMTGLMIAGPWGALAGGIIGGLRGAFGGDPAIMALNDTRDAWFETQGGFEELARKIEQQGVKAEPIIKALFDAKTPKEFETAVQAANDALGTRARIQQGLLRARGGLETLFGELANLKDSPELQAAISAIEGKIAEAFAKAGLGFMATGALRESEAFGAAQRAAGGGAEVLAGMREAGMVDTGLMAATGALATELQQQAVQAALDAGLSQEEAQKAGFGAISQILKEQLNASIQSGTELDENTKALIEEARKNGIEILADPAIESLAVQREQLEVMKAGFAQAGKPAGGEEGGRREREADVGAAGGLSGMTRNMGGGLGPRIQTHAGELVSIIPESNVMAGLPSWLGTGTPPSLRDMLPPEAVAAMEALGRQVNPNAGQGPIINYSLGGLTMNANPLRNMQDQYELAEFVIDRAIRGVERGEGRLYDALREVARRG